MVTGLTSPAAARPATVERHVIVRAGRDRELSVLWLQLDSIPSRAWCTAFLDGLPEGDGALRAALHERYVLCTATDHDADRVARLAHQRVTEVSCRR